MAKGGARARSGPAPDPEALRRDRADDAAGWTTLPAAGYSGPVPEWPLTEASERELELWERAWRRPQAERWACMQLEDGVALYVRSLVIAEAPGATSKALELVIRQQEYLGLSIPGLLRNKWKIAEPATVASVKSAPARAGLKIVQGGK